MSGGSLQIQIDYRFHVDHGSQGDCYVIVEVTDSSQLSYLKWQCDVKVADSSQLLQLIINVKMDDRSTATSIAIMQLQRIHHNISTNT